MPATKFAGATVRSYDATVGWNEQSSLLTIELVEDTLNGDAFTRPAVGTPLTFTSGDFVFRGIIQRWREFVNSGANSVFEITLMDPREILAGVQVILASYNGATNMVPNLLNAYGYWESQLGFGGALVNESGMFWNADFSVTKLGTGDGGGIVITPTDSHVGIMPAVTAMTTGNGGVYGGRIQFRGHEYSVDLSGLPLPPPYYRIGGTAVSLLDAISQICQDGGFDYIVILDDDVIKFRCVSRQSQPNIGEVANYIQGLTDCPSKEFGQELRNETTNGIIMGGDVQQLVSVLNPIGDQTIWPYWGKDIDNNVIMGEGRPETGQHVVRLNATPIADIVGGPTYDVDLFELRCALSDFDSWAAYVIRFYPEKAETIGLCSAIDSEGEFSELFPDVIFSRDLIAQRDEDMLRFGEMNESEFWTKRAQRAYEFVQTYASQFFGRKFLVRVPFYLFWKYEPETTHLITSDEPSDGGFVPEGSQPLGLEFLNEGSFLLQDGRFQCFVRFPAQSQLKYDLQKLQPGDGVLQNNGLFLKASVDTDVGVVYPAGSLYPYVVVELASPVYEIAKDILGGIEDIALMLNMDVAALVDGVAERHGSWPVRIHPAPYRPEAVALPMKSNRQSYGPWGTFGSGGSPGVAGKVNFERDEGLVPWNYGDFNSLNQAAMAKLANSATNMQVSEVGSAEQVGEPTISLGDMLVAGGPNVTGISVRFGESGITTSYSMQTYTPRLVGFSKDNADRFRRMGLQAQDMRRAVRQLFQQSKEARAVRSVMQQGRLFNISRAVAQQSPHEILMGSMRHYEQSGYRTRVSVGDLREVAANIRADKPERYWGMGAMSLEGLLRPFSTALGAENAGDMPHFQVKNSNIPASAASQSTYNMFKEGCDIDILASGEKGEYTGSIHRLKPNKETGVAIDYENARPLGHLMPMYASGWGLEVTGKPVPNETEVTYDETTGEASPPIHEWSDDFKEDHLKHPETWRSGPILLHWDDWRKGWTIPTVLFGTLDSTLSGSGSVKMSIKVLGFTLEDKVDVYNTRLGGGTLNAGTRVCAVYYPLENRWHIISAAC